MSEAQCRCGRWCSSRSGLATHARRCPVQARWEVIAYADHGPFTVESTRRAWRLADDEVLLVLADADDLLDRIVNDAVRKVIPTRGVRRFADLQQHVDANAYLADLVADDGDMFEHANAVTARVDQLLADTSLSARVRLDGDHAR